MPDLELAAAFRGNFLDRNVLDPGRWRAVTKLGNQLLDRRFVAFDLRLDRAVRAIAPPATDR